MRRHSLLPLAAWVLAGITVALRGLAGQEGGNPDAGATSPSDSPTSVFDPDYARNGVFYTIHMEDPSARAPAAPRPGAVPGLDLSGYVPTPAITTPTVNGRIDREAVLIEWTDRDTGNANVRGHGAGGAVAAAAVSGRGRVDMRSAEDDEGELYVLTKSDGMIRQVVGLR